MFMGKEPNFVSTNSSAIGASGRTRVDAVLAALHGARPA